MANYEISNEIKKNIGKNYTEKKLKFLTLLKVKNNKFQFEDQFNII